MKQLSSIEFRFDDGDWLDVPARLIFLLELYSKKDIRMFGGKCIEELNTNTGIKVGFHQEALSLVTLAGNEIKWKLEQKDIESIVICYTDGSCETYFVNWFVEDSMKSSGNQYQYNKFGLEEGFTIQIRGDKK